MSDHMKAAPRRFLLRFHLVKSPVWTLAALLLQGVSGALAAPMVAATIAPVHSIASYIMGLVLITQKTEALLAIVFFGAVITLFQIYMAYFGLGQLGIRLDSFVALLIGITFNNAGYLTQNFRGALKAIPETQSRAGRSDKQEIC